LILRAIGRLILVPLGLLLATVAAILVLLSLGLELSTHALSGRTIDGDTIEAFFRVAYGVVSLAAVATIVPAILVVIVGEVARIRSLLYYVVAGGLALAIMPMLASYGPASVTPLATGRLWAVFATAGFTGGFVYWLIAGRSA
jgi:hypothetical protein